MIKNTYNDHQINIDNRAAYHWESKSICEKQGRSLSDIIENYLKVVVTENAEVERDIAPIAKSLKGSFKKPSDFDYKKQLTTRLTEKYLQ